jgi:transposase
VSIIDSGHSGDGVARRTKRLWTDAEKRSICFQTTAPGVSVAQVARRYAVSANLIFKWSSEKQADALKVLFQHLKRFFYRFHDARL